MPRRSTPTPRGRRAWATVGASLLAALVLSGCHPYPAVPYGANLADGPALGRTANDHVVIRCLLATDRRQTGAVHPGLFFGIERTHGLTLGRCEVTIPAAHYRGRLETPPPFDPGKPGKHVLLQSVETVARAGWIADLRERIRGMHDSGTSPQVFVFVHGYAVSFEDAARRTAQLARIIHG